MAAPLWRKLFHIFGIKQHIIQQQGNCQRKKQFNDTERKLWDQAAQTFLNIHHNSQKNVWPCAEKLNFD